MLRRSPRFEPAHDRTRHSTAAGRARETRPSSWGRLRSAGHRDCAELRRAVRRNPCSCLFLHRELVACVRLIFSGSQLAAQKLAGRGAGNGLHEHVFPGALEAGEAASQARIVELIRCELGARRFNESHHLGAEPLVWHSDDGASRNELAAREGILHFLRKNVFPAADDHVVDAADDVELAILVELSEIARAVPAALDGLGIGVGALPVARERLWAAHAGDNLTSGARRQVDLDIVVAGRRNDSDDLIHTGAPGAAGLAVEMIAVAEGVDLTGTIVVDA